MACGASATDRAMPVNGAAPRVHSPKKMNGVSRESCHPTALRQVRATGDGARPLRLGARWSHLSGKGGQPEDLSDGRASSNLEASDE